MSFRGKYLVINKVLFLYPKNINVYQIDGLSLTEIQNLKFGSVLCFREKLCKIYFDQSIKHLHFHKRPRFSRSSVKLSEE